MRTEKKTTPEERNKRDKSQIAKTKRTVKDGGEEGKTVLGLGSHEAPRYTV